MKRLLCFVVCVFIFTAVPAFLREPTVRVQASIPSGAGKIILTEATGREYFAGELLVKLRVTSAAKLKVQNQDNFELQATAKQIRDAFGFESVEPLYAAPSQGRFYTQNAHSTIPSIQQWHLATFKTVSLENEGLQQEHTEILTKLRNDPEIEYAELNYALRLRQNPGEFIPNDPLFNLAWDLNNIQAPSAWLQQSTFKMSGPKIRVGVVDTPINFNHPDLHDNVWTNPGEIPGNGIDDDGDGFVDDFNDVNVIGAQLPTDRFALLPQHGSAAFGEMFAGLNNGIGSSGVVGVPGIEGISLIVGPNDLSGQLPLSAVLRSMSWSAVNAQRFNIKVLSMSLGARGFSQAASDAVDDCVKAGITVVVAAGERLPLDLDNPSNFDMFSSLPAVIGVTASGHSNEILPSSDWGVERLIAAPGIGNITTGTGTYPNDYVSFAGTSAATPLVAGVATQIIQDGLASDPADVKELIFTSAGMTSTPEKVKRLLNFYQALVTPVVFNLPRISGVSYGGSKKMVITGVRFGSSPVVIINNVEVDPSAIKSASDTKLKLKTNRNNYNLHSGPNFVQVRDGDHVSQAILLVV